MGYSAEEIRKAREYIKKRAIADLFSKKGGANFFSLSGRDIESLFGTYDEVFFQNQISQKLTETPGTHLRFFASERTSGAGGMCTIERDGEECTYYLDIAPNILNTIFKTNKDGLQDAAGIGCKDRVDCLLLIMEHQIIHLLLILWGYYPPEDTEEEIYGSHGALFACMAKEYFGHTSIKHDLGISSINVTGDDILEGALVKAIKKPPPFGYAYWSNSCYLDSLLVVLLENASSFWRIGMMESNVNSFVYPKGGGICDVGAGSKITTVFEVRQHAQKIQNQIKNDFQLLENPGKYPPKCSLLRGLLAECLPGMRKGGWVTFSTNLVYDMLVGLFPILAMDVPIQIHRWKDSKKGWVPEPVKYQKLGSFGMWEYLENPADTAEEGVDYKELRWDLLQAQGIAFFNGGSPRIKNFGEEGQEKGYNIIVGDEGTKTRHPFNVKKARKFGETIIDDRYRLVGVVTLQGVSPTGEGGSHYVAHLLGRDHKWYYYNDIGSKLVPVKKLPVSGVWKEEDREMPAMYFYQKIKDATTPKKPEEIQYVGDRLDYRRITSSKGEVSYFIYDKTEERKIMIELSSNLKGARHIDDHTLFWKSIPGVDVEALLEKLDTSSYTKRPRDGIDSVDYGKLYKTYPKIKVYNYSDRLVAIVGPGAGELMNRISGGLEINLKYGLGRGYIFPKNKLEELDTAEKHA